MDPAAGGPPPNSARIWNYWLGGTDYSPADRAVGEQRRRVTVSTCRKVTGENSRCLGRQELLPRRRRPPRRGTETGGGQDPADCPRSDPVSQAKDLALDAQVSPPRVLPRQLLHERADLVRHRRPSRRVRVGPLS